MNQAGLLEPGGVAVFEGGGKRVTNTIKGVVHNISLSRSNFTQTPLLLSDPAPLALLLSSQAIKMANAQVFIPANFTEMFP